MRKLLIVIAVFSVAVVAAAAFVLLMSPSTPDRRPALVQVPPLPPVTRTSVVVTPVAVALPAIRDAMEAAAPRNLAGKRDNPLTGLLSNADIGWTVARGPLALAGRPEGLTLTTTVTGALRVTGQIAAAAGNVTGALGGILSGALGKEMQNLTGRVIDQRADVRGDVRLTSRPTLLPEWRLEPGLAAQVTIADGALTIAGLRLNVANEVKPLLDRQVNEQTAVLQGRIRNDPFIEQAARREWAKMCRSISLAAGPGAPGLWLELRPTRAFAAQPRIDANAVTLTVGVQAETRIAPSETKPDCPFPARLDIVPQTEQGKVAIGVPIDVPFTEINKLLEAQLKGRTFPEDGSGAVDVTVERASVAASGDRLLISLRIKAREKKSFFSFGAEATVHVWGRPALDRERQILRLTDIVLDVESDAALGLLGAAARAAVPYLQAALAERAVIDLKPFAASAQKSIAAAIAEFRSREGGVRVDAAVTAMRLVGIEFDAKTLRVVAEADGTVAVAVNALPAL